MREPDSGDESSPDVWCFLPQAWLFRVGVSGALGGPVWPSSSRPPPPPPHPWEPHPFSPAQWFSDFIVELISVEAQGCEIVFVVCLRSGGQEGINCTFLPGKFFCGE